MAEFQEVVKQANRMCRSFGAVCDGCKLHWLDGEALCVFGGTPEAWRSNKMTDAERIVMDWAAEHPELRYPSWHEAWKQLFPDGQGSPCPTAYGMKYEPEWCGSDDCKKCKGRPIPADIAEKLGIKPIGGKTDENA